MQDFGQQYVVQRSQAAVVIGWLVFLFGLITILMTPLSLIDAVDLDGNPITIPTHVKIISIVLNIIVGLMYIVGGLKLKDYEREGAWISLGAVLFAFAGGLIVYSIYPGGSQIYGPEIGPIFDVSLIAGTACCSVFCGAIIAIPLILANGGLEKKHSF